MLPFRDDGDRNNSEILPELGLSLVRSDVDWAVTIASISSFGQQDKTPRPKLFSRKLVFLEILCYADKAVKTRRQSAGIAQSVEQRTENPRVTSSSLVSGIV
jgi:hypothetical protein